LITRERKAPGEGGRGKRRKRIMCLGRERMFAPKGEDGEYKERDGEGKEEKSPTKCISAG